ncbi:MAG TPA: cytochrome C552 [Burkholderiales bacterium]|nr:cytochrome C552 [Burkholderiales bacterium]
MRRLADESGCTLCHAERPQRLKGDAVPPPAPAWSDIAQRYRGRRGAEEKLVQVVVHGAGPDQRHWEGKTSDIAMPANPVEISEDDARLLVRWILRHGP